MNRKSLAFGGTLFLSVGMLALSVVNHGPAASGSFAFVQNQDKKDQPAQKKKNQNRKKAGTGTGANAGLGRLNAEYVGAMIDMAREGGAEVLSSGDSYDDFVSVAQKADGTVFVGYAAYFDGHDQIRLHKLMPNGNWSTRAYCPTVEARADIWMPQLAVDANDRLWVIWCEQTGHSKGKSGNFDLYARTLLADEWGPIVRLTTDAKPDINPHVTTDAARNIHVVWQAHPENNGDVQYCKFDGKNWSKPIAVTSDAEADWYPHAAVDAQGTVWIVFDSYRNGDYDVFLTSLKDGKPGQVVPIASSTYYEAHPSVACTPDGRVWVAWEQGGHNWGKDQGYWLRRESREQGTTLGSTRAVKTACYHLGKVLSGPDLTAALPEDERNQATAMAELAAASDGRLWLRYRHMVRGQPRAQGGFTRGWTENVTWLGADGWTTAQAMPASHGRISVFSRILPSKEGGLLFAYSGDARSIENFHRPIHDTAMVRIVAKPEGAPGVPKLAEYKNPDPPAAVPAWNTNQEQREVAAIRNHRVNIDGVPHRIVRGDLHRHTELSWDVGPGNDGSYLDFYRYMIDVASMDFGGLSDHQGGGHYPYWWWLTEKSCDMYYLAPRFVPLYGYERSARFPHGHRNVFHAYRGVPVFPFQIRLDQSGAFPGVAAGNLMDNDTKLLYEYLHRSGGIAMSHTSATAQMGTDWRDNDPYIEPVVEIYQGARNSYEAFGTPRVHPKDEEPAKAPGGFQQAGLVWNAYEKGYRLGTITSSDHGSTHISFAMVYTPENDRQQIIDSMRKRQTYGSTGNLIVEGTINGQFMGREITTKEKPVLTLTATGTGSIAQVQLVRNNEFVYTTTPKKQQIDIKYTDMEPKAGLNFYYFRILQEDGEVAWASPVWVNYQK
jgi:hypothetical protein